MVQEAEKYAEEDGKQKERIEAKNSLESYVFNMKTSVEDEKVRGGPFLDFSDWFLCRGMKSFVPHNIITKCFGDIRIKRDARYVNVDLPTPYVTLFLDKIIKSNFIRERNKYPLTYLA